MYSIGRSVRSTTSAPTSGSSGGDARQRGCDPSASRGRRRRCPRSRSQPPSARQGLGSRPTEGLCHRRRPPAADVRIGPGRGRRSLDRTCPWRYGFVSGKRAGGDGLSNRLTLKGLFGCDARPRSPGCRDRAPSAIAATIRRQSFVAIPWTRTAMRNATLQDSVNEAHDAARHEPLHRYGGSARAYS